MLFYYRYSPGSPMSAAHTSCAVLFWDSSLKNQWFVTLLTFSRVVKLTRGLDPSDSIVTATACLEINCSAWHSCSRRRVNKRRRITHYSNVVRYLSPTAKSKWKISVREPLLVLYTFSSSQYQSTVVVMHAQIRTKTPLISFYEQEIRLSYFNEAPVCLQFTVLFHCALRSKG